MANRTLKDAIHTSDKLAACNTPADDTLTLPFGDAARLAYAYIFVPQQDDYGCFELNPAVMMIQCCGRWQSPLPPDTILRFAQVLNHHGLLFVWEQQDKKWGYLTGKEAGRLPEPSRRHKRKTPICPSTDALGLDPLIEKPDPKNKRLEAKRKELEIKYHSVPACIWPEVTEYLSTYKQLQLETDGLLEGFKLVRAASASPQTTTASPQLPTEHPQGATLARGGADLDPDPDPDPDLNPPSSASQSSQSTNTGTASKNRRKTGPTTFGKEILKKLAEKVGGNGQLQKHYEKAIYRNDLLTGYDNVSRVKESFTELAKWTIYKAAKLLLVQREQELKMLGTEELGDFAWQKLQGKLGPIERLKNYDSRKKQLAGKVIKAVAAGAIELVGQLQERK